jgi:NADP-dependent 3-hydroxy acid dehydrogenase YdfG
VRIARRAERLRELAQELSRITQVADLVLDVRDRAAVMALDERLPAPLRDIEILINNAGLALGLEPAQSVDLDDWEAMVDTNVKGLMFMTRLLLPGMIRQGGGHVVNLGSVAAAWPYPGGNAYGGTKAFVRQFSRNLRSDLLGKGVRVTSIDPGMTDTEFSLVRFHGDSDRARAVYAGMQPLSADDVAEAILWATSLPAHVNVNCLELMPTAQAWGPFAVHRA